MKRSAFRHYNLSQATRHQLDVKSFLGVDYSTQKFLIADGHAIDLKNYIYKDGVMQKRNGVEQVLIVKTFEYIPANFETQTEPLVEEIHSNEENKTINGMWKFEAEDGKKHVVAHIGKLMYEITDIDNDFIEAKPITTGQATVDGEIHYLAYEFEDYKSFAVVGGKKLWFLGGNKYMCLRFVLVNPTTTRAMFFALEDSDHTPIPTTTISITYKNSIVNRRMGLDNVNLLTMWRKNKLISGTSKQEDEKTKTTFFEYTLDAPLIVKDRKDMADIEVTIEEQGDIE